MARPFISAEIYLACSILRGDGKTPIGILKSKQELGFVSTVVSKHTVWIDWYHVRVLHLQNFDVECIYLSII